MKTKLQLFMVLVLFYILPLPCISQFSRDQAKDLVLNQILAAELGTINVYCDSDMVSQPDKILTYSNTKIELPFVDNWVFFSDDRPFLNWNHSCRYIFVNSQSGEYYTVTDKTIYPFDWESKYETISQIFIQLPNPINAPTPRPLIQVLPPNPHLYAVIIVGEAGLSIIGGAERFWRDVSAMYVTLRKVYGYEKDHIYIHYTNPVSNPAHHILGYDLDPNDPGIEIKYTACWDTIHKTFKNFGGDHSDPDPRIPTLHEDDQLFIFIDGHGSANADFSNGIINCQCLGSYNELDAITFNSWMNNIHCGQMIFLHEQCNAGAWKTPLKNTNNAFCYNRTIQTACDSAEGSYPEDWLSYGLSGTQTSFYDEYTFYWTAAARGYFPDIQYPWENGDPICCPFPQAFIDVFNLACPNHPNNLDPDLNGDHFVTMNEAFSYADSMDTWSPCKIVPCVNEYYCPHDGVGFEHPQNSRDISFKEDLQTLAGLNGKITATNQTVANRSYVVGGTLQIVNGATLNFSPGSRVYFIGEGGLTAEGGTTLNPGNNMLFAGNDNNRVDIIYATMGGLDHVTFSNDPNDPPGTTFGGLYLANIMPTTMSHVTFDHARFWKLLSPKLTISDSSSFTYCDYFNSTEGNVDISHSQFNNTFIYLAWPGNGSDAKIDSNTFTTSNNPYNSDMIDLNNFSTFNINHNTIINANHSGIGLYYCGNGAGDKIVSNNHITDCNIGIKAYYSTATIQNNHISSTVTGSVGAKFLNRGSINLQGNPYAQSSGATQEIKDNGSYEIYAGDQSFPLSFAYNVITDWDDMSNPLVYYENSISGSFDVRNNCWGSNQIPDQLHADHGVYLWDPTWCPAGGGEDNQEPAEDMYNTADSLFSNGNFSGAKLLFESLIQSYPDSKFAQAALKNLFSLEQFAGNDYAGLKQYYLTNDSISADSTLSAIGQFLANRCDVQQQNWPQSIEWYENRIMNPPSDVDSICAIIDLENIYLLMENDSTKSTYTGKFPQYRPSSLLSFRNYRDSLIAMLPFDLKKKPSTDPICRLKENALLQNFPNPFSQSTEIWYRLGPNCSLAIIKITDNLGRIYCKFDSPDLSEGIHKIKIDVNVLVPGIYQYSLEVNGKMMDTKKMVVIR